MSEFEQTKEEILAHQGQVYELLHAAIKENTKADRLTASLECTGTEPDPPDPGDPADDILPGGTLYPGVQFQGMLWEPADGVVRITMPSIIQTSLMDMTVGMQIQHGSNPDTVIGRADYRGRVSGLELFEYIDSGNDLPNNIVVGIRGKDAPHPWLFYPVPLTRESQPASGEDPIVPVFWLPDGNPVPPPPPPPDPTTPYALKPSYWVEGAFPQLKGTIGPSNRIFMAGLNPAPSGGTSFKVVPWAGQPVWSDRQIGSWLQQTKGEGWDRIMFDVENNFWYRTGYLAKFVSMAKMHGFKVGLGVKYSWAELSGNPHVDVGGDRGVRDHIAFYKSLNPDCYCGWGYGRHESHISFWNAGIDNGIPANRIMLLHDWFRMQSNGYIGLQEFPKLLSWARQNPSTRLIGGFQPHRDGDDAREARMVNALREAYSGT